MLAEAIVVAVQRFYLSPEVDAHTGVLRVSELRDSLPGRLAPYLSRQVVTRRLGSSRRAAAPGGAARACRTRRPAASPARARAPRGSTAWCAGPSASAGCTACARWVENPTASRKSAGTTHRPARPRVSPNASTALTPPRRIRSLAIPCTIIRPSPPPRCSASTCAVVRITASVLTGAVANPSAAGHVHRRCPDQVAHDLTVDDGHPAARAPLAQHHRDPGGLLLGLVAAHRARGVRDRAPRTRTPRSRPAAVADGRGSTARSCVPRATRRPG